MEEFSTPSYHLGIRDLKWRVEARGFVPVDVQFRLSREPLLQLLSEEIYHHDEYVFLRELIQNAIDAIELRRILLRRHGVPSFEGIITLEVERLDGGSAVVRCRDNGVGMSMRIVQRFFSQVGQSFYQTDEFRRAAGPAEPIARFGVGILSCFRVADDLTIETRADPYFQREAKGLRIRIPGPRNRFRVEEVADDRMKVGTTIEVRVSEVRRRLSGALTPETPLKVWKYVSQVAAFSPYDIVVAENNVERTVGSGEGISAGGAATPVVAQHVAYPWARVFPANHVSGVRQLFRCLAIDIRRDLKLHGYRGVVFGLLPREGPISYATISVTSCPAVRGLLLPWVALPWASTRFTIATKEMTMTVLCQALMPKA